MHAPAVALSWQLWGRHRWGLTLALGCSLAVLLLVALLPADAPARHAVALVGWIMVLPLILTYLVAVFAYGFDGTALQTRESAFPARLFTLPVRTALLAGCPMLQGTAAVVLAWIAWAALVPAADGSALPLVWPALLLAAVLAWLQAILWSPFGLPYVRLAALLLVSATLGLLAVAGTLYGVGAGILAAGFAALLAPAYLAAWLGLASARHGSAAVRPRQVAVRAAAAPWPAPRAFASPARAQLWYEWRRHGVGFPLVVGCILLPYTAPTLLLARFDPVVVMTSLYPGLASFSWETVETFFLFHTLVLVPPLAAALLGVELGALGPIFRPSSFLLTRPLGSGALVLAKFQVGALSTLAALAVTGLIGFAWLALTGAAADVATWWGQVVETYGPARAWSMPVLAVIGFAGLAWLHLCKNVSVGFLGNPWPQLFVPVGAVTLVGIGLLAQWLYREPAARAQLWPILPWLLAAAILLKALAAGAALVCVRRRRLWPAQVPAVLLGVWLLTAGCCFTLLAWVVPAGVPLPLVAAGVVLALPLARLLAAPLALEAGRRG